MAHLISFRTSVFDPDLEPENPINPIAGQSALVWIRGEVLGGEYESTEPDCEDWGWYIEVQAEDATYTVGAICFEQEEEIEGGMRDWMIQVVERRRLSLFRRRTATAGGDRLTQLIAQALRADEAFQQVTVEAGR